MSAESAAPPPEAPPPEPPPPDPMAQVAAAESLSRDPSQTVATLLEQARSFSEPMARAVLYRRIGSAFAEPISPGTKRRPISPHLATMRSVAGEELDPEAAR